MGPILKEETEKERKKKVVTLGGKKEVQRGKVEGWNVRRKERNYTVIRVFSHTKKDNPFACYPM